MMDLPALTEIVRAALKAARQDYDNPPRGSNPFATAVTGGGAVTALHYLLAALEKAQKRQR